ncbi:N-6 DNA methylase [Paracoccus sp. 08]|uniref:N-6 DNA methylase n=1 Tax=Paracoccus sp. 08 TaxID=2606624 RepID=UPI002095BFE9|nr:N-6 DNA methylase [Paracoccus sp. 08]MCO6361543.1 N-6 DNA methylase [Paracoccus sp. 08]
MAGTKKPKSAPATPWPDEADELHREGDWLWIPLRSEWRDVSSKPEELVRQKFIRHLCDGYAYSLAQMDQERRTMHGHKSPRADVVIWETPEAKADNKTPVLVIECKAENVDINIRDYYQGESYTRAVGCEFFIAHNNRFTAIFKLVPGLPGDFVQINEIAKASDWGDAKRIEEIKNKLRAFNRKEFQDLLLDCHNILRDVHKMDPGRAFDTISKILFVKMYIERSGSHGTFTTDFIEGRKKYRTKSTGALHEELFEETKEYYRSDDLFAAGDRLEISEATFQRIVKKLERFDLSKTGDDIKGLAFEKFLGNTFRGELGQFFTPRPVVEFMVSLLDPQEDELICDPAAGSGGFLIRAFEHVRDAVSADIQRQKDSARAEIEARGLDPEEEEKLIDEAFARLNHELLPSGDDNSPINTRVGRLAWNCVFGCDAEPRAARTAKMNMIMHGDGHGGIHYHDGLIDINGIFPERFDILITNPPFGANVGRDQQVGGSEETSVRDDPAYRARCRKRYGDEWEANHDRMLAAEKSKTKILDLFEIGKGKNNRATEIVFVERCLNLLKPGGRMGIVLPDGNLNNPSLTWLRRWCEGKARILGVVSLPEETFSSAKATVKASLVFLRRFTEADETAWEAAWAKAHADQDATFNAQRDTLCGDLGRRVVTAEDSNVEYILTELAKLGVERSTPAWTAGPEPDYPRGIGSTKIGKPKWNGTASNAKEATKLKRDYMAAFDADTQKRSDAFWRELTAGLRAIDAAHDAALWATVREEFDYPVFVAAPKSVGITSTGDTGDSVPNELPALLEAYRAFEGWVEAGANPEDTPGFLLPSAA